jgi:hypothetical protein
VATAKGLAFVDANALLSQILQQVFLLWIYSVIFFYNWWRFSTDGVHPSQGYALIK